MILSLFFCFLNQVKNKGKTIKSRKFFYENDVKKKDDKVLLAEGGKKLLFQIQIF